MRRRAALWVLLAAMGVLAACLPGGAPDVISESPLPPHAVAADMADPSAELVAEAESELASEVSGEPLGVPADEPLAEQLPAAPALPPALAAQQRRCAETGGQLSARGDGLFACLRQTRDGGRQCRRAADCEGYCLARSGSCAPIAPLFGCHEVLGSDGRRTTLCLD